MKVLVGYDNPNLTDDRIKEVLEQFISNEFGISIRYKDGTICNVKRVSVDDIEIVEHIPLFEFENEAELYEYLPIPKKVISI